MSGPADVDVFIQSCVGTYLSVFADIMRSVPFPSSCCFPCGGTVDVHLNQKSCWASASLIYRLLLPSALYVPFSLIILFFTRV